ncbi:MAG: hypothetical protein HY035_11630 [Nitrospirae bacterium]|nr:hypothetical protein [Nitrospirota bacterium]
MAKKAPKKNNNVVDLTLRDVAAALPSVFFKSCKEKRIAVKVIDHGGNEVMVVREIF